MILNRNVRDLNNGQNSVKILLEVCVFSDHLFLQHADGFHFSKWSDNFLEPLLGVRKKYTFKILSNATKENIISMSMSCWLQFKLRNTFVYVWRRQSCWNNGLLWLGLHNILQLLYSFNEAVSFRNASTSKISLFSMLLLCSPCSCSTLFTIPVPTALSYNT